MNFLKAWIAASGLPAAMLALSCTCVPSAVQAQQTQASTVAAGIEWRSLNEDQHQVLRNFEKRWSQLPPARQRRLSAAASRWSTMSPDERARTRQRFNQWQQLPENRRKHIRESYSDFRSLSPEQQQRLRRNFKRFQQLPPEQRKALRNRWRGKTPAQREQAKERASQRRLDKLNQQ